MHKLSPDTEALICRQFIWCGEQFFVKGLRQVLPADSRCRLICSICQCLGRFSDWLRIFFLIWSMTVLDFFFGLRSVYVFSSCLRLRVVLDFQLGPFLVLSCCVYFMMFFFYIVGWFVLFLDVFLVGQEGFTCMFFLSCMFTISPLLIPQLPFTSSLPSFFLSWGTPPILSLKHAVALPVHSSTCSSNHLFSFNTVNSGYLVILIAWALSLDVLLDFADYIMCFCSLNALLITVSWFCWLSLWVAFEVTGTSARGRVSVSFPLWWPVGCSNAAFRWIIFCSYFRVFFIVILFNVTYCGRAELTLNLYMVNVVFHHFCFFIAFVVVVILFDDPFVRFRNGLPLNFFVLLGKIIPIFFNT